jgi:hypothetical protein
MVFNDFYQRLQDMGDNLLDFGIYMATLHPLVAGSAPRIS